MNLEQEYLRSILLYDPEAGVFTWKSRPLSHFKSDRYRRSWNTTYAGKRAGSVAKVGTGQYRYIYVAGKLQYEHRLAYLYVTGEMPPDQVDHINRDGLDNRWSNLRLCSSSSNRRNQSMSIKNTSGITGVYWVSEKRKWKAEVGVGKGKRRHIGYFEDKLEAGKAVRKAYIEHGYDPGHGLAPAPYRQE